jgi:hypothetical protein
VKALECLQDMYRNKLEPTAAHYNLVIRTLKAEGYVEKMFKMVMAVSFKEGARINGNTFELCIEAVIEQGQWKVYDHHYHDDHHHHNHYYHLNHHHHYHNRYHHHYHHYHHHHHHHYHHHYYHHHHMNIQEALLLIQSMERLSFKPSMQTYVSLVELLERARQYRAVLALYR